MPTDTGTLERWYEGEEIPGVLFSLNDSVLAPPGRIHQDDASVISLESVAPEVVYLIEKAEGEDLIVRQEDLSFILYMPMLDEGTDVWRPVCAKRLDRSVAQVLSACPEEETWQFPQGARVRFAEKQLSDGPRLVATGLAGDAA